MNKYPSWLNALVLTILLAGCLFALPNIYGSVEAVQIADNGGAEYDEAKLDEFVRVVENAGIAPEAAYLQDGRVVIRFDKTEDQEIAGERLKAAYDRDANVATTLAPRLPEWIRKLGLNPMSLGLDLRGGVYVLLEVDMQTAIDSRMKGYQQDFDDRLRDARIRHRVDLSDQLLSIRLTSPEDADAARTIIERTDPNLLIGAGADDQSLTVRMSEAQIKERQDFAIEQNLTTLRNRVNQLSNAS
jgi:preprotein translocase subunit SecD